MSNYEAFDDNIKEQFGDYSPEVHPRIWENIIKEREKRKPVGFWLSFFNGKNILIITALFLATATTGYLLLQKNSSKKENISAVTNKQQLQTAAVTTTGENNNGTKHPVPTTTTTNNSTGKPGAFPLNNNVADANTDAAINSTGKHRNTTATKSLYKIKMVAPFTETDNATELPAKPKKGTTTANEYDITNEEVVYGQTTRDNFLKHILFTDLQKITTDKKEITLKKRYFPNVALPDCPSVEKNAAGNKTYIEVYGGPDIAFLNLTDTGNSAYLQKRKESTKFSSAYSAGLRYTRVFGNGVSVRTGINYSQINEKFTFIQGNIVQVTYLINANGDTTGSYLTSSTRYKTSYNKFKTIDVPLLVGYEMGNGKFHANINAGVIVNAYSWQKGEVLDTSFNPVSITTGKTSSPYQFKTNIGIGFTAGASMYYKLNEKLHLLAEPYFRYNLSPMSKEKLTLTQKYHTAGLRLGVRLDLH